MPMHVIQRAALGLATAVALIALFAFRPMASGLSDAQVEGVVIDAMSLDGGSAAARPSPDATSTPSTSKVEEIAPAEASSPGPPAVTVVPPDDDDDDRDDMEDGDDFDD